jgi:DNA-binding MarR family transcriptional regulator
MSNPTVLEQYLLTSKSKSIVILLWLLNNRDKDNFVEGTLQRISDECGVTKVTVNRVFQELYKEGFMEKIRNSQYKLLRV